MQVLLKNETLAGHVHGAIVGSEAEIDKKQAELKEYEERLRGANEIDKPSIQRKIARADRAMAKASQNLAAFRWVEVFVVPRLPGDRFLLFTMIMGLLLVLTLLKLVCMFVEEMLIGSG